MPDAAGTPPLLMDFYGRLAAAREEGRQAGRREVLNIVERHRQWALQESAGNSAYSELQAARARLLKVILFECNVLPTEEARDDA